MQGNGREGRERYVESFGGGFDPHGDVQSSGLTQPGNSGSVRGKYKNSVPVWRF